MAATRSHELPARLQQTCLRPELLPPQVHRAVNDAMQHGLSAVVVPPVWVQRVGTMLRASGESSTRLCAVIGFPHGTSKSTVKAIEATSCIKDGADAIAVVAYLPNLIRRDLDAAKFELLEIARAARMTRRDVSLHVIVETALLARANPDEIEPMLVTACRAARESGCDAIVTGTGFAAADRAIDHDTLRLLRRHAEGLTITAMGGIDDIERMTPLLDAGAAHVASERAADLVVEFARAQRAGSEPG